MRPRTAIANGIVLAGLVASLAGCGAVGINVAGDAMAPTLKNGEKAVGTREFEQLNRGDIVGFKYPKDESKNFMKRIVGLPGERIESVGGKVSINGQRLSEDYVATENQSNDTWGPRTVPDGEFFVMGDNRRNSSDSRMWGTVRRTAIWAKIIIH